MRAPIDLAIVGPQGHHQAAVHAVHGAGELGVELLQGLLCLDLLEEGQIGHFGNCVHCASNLFIGFIRSFWQVRCTAHEPGWFLAPEPACSES
ncbi:hypothetical protein D9M71_823790 [compost metagenome]